MSDTPQIPEIQMTINGQRVTAAEKFDVENPATGQPFAQAPDCTEAELGEAIAAARAALPGWRGTPIEERRQALQAIAGKIAENAQELSQLMTLEQGKPLQEAAADILGGAHWIAENAKNDLPEQVSEDSGERKAVTRYVPLGVVAAVVPWNFPVTLAGFKLGPALLAGNTVVLKPAPTTPLTTLRIGELVQEVLPPGVLNVVSGSDRLGPWLTSHDGIDKVSFTGSTQTGRKVMAAAAPTLKKVTLELGGNDAGIVLPDVDVDQVAEQLFWAAFRNAGQICIATKRLYVHEGVYEPLKHALARVAADVKVGNGLEDGTQIGPVQNRRQYRRVLELIDDSRQCGYDFVVGGEVPDTEDDGFFVPVSIVDNPPEDSRIVQEEQFGPVLPMIKVTSVDEAVERANASEYGLGATVWTRDLDQAAEIASRLQAGTVWINESLHLSPHAPFGGFKQSGVGVENGKEGLLEFCQTQTIFMRKGADSAA